MGETNEEFQSAVTDLLIIKDNQDEVTKVLRQWRNATFDVNKVSEKWAKDLYSEGRNAPFEACANFELEKDRVDYARYLFTGFIFGDESAMQIGNVTMFTVPKEMKCEKVDDENFLYTFNFSHPDFSYDETLFKSIDGFMMKKIQELIDLVEKEQLILQFMVATVDPENSDILEEIKNMNAYSIDWSNIIDYFSKEDFMKMVKATNSEDTVHYVHMMNWVSSYKGASVFDYEHNGKIELIKAALEKHRMIHEYFWNSAENYRKMWSKEIKYENTTNLVDFALTVECHQNYLDAFFGDIQIKGQTSMAHRNLRRSHTTIYGGFTLDAEASLGVYLH